MTNGDQAPSEGQGQTLPSTSNEQPGSGSRKKPSAKTVDLIADLGLRYPPANQADLIAHAATLRLLSEDVAHVPVRWLESAIGVWVRSKPFLPKASELITSARLAKENAQIDAMGPKGETMAERGNRLMSDLGQRRGLAWIDDGNGGAYLEQVAEDKTVRN